MSHPGAKTMTSGYSAARQDSPRGKLGTWAIRTAENGFEVGRRIEREETLFHTHWPFHYEDREIICRIRESRGKKPQS